jgi:hypothetical protein
VAQGVCKYACSEEVPEPVDLQGSGFSVAFDPLDGSSIVDTNFTVGTIFGVWPGDKLTGITGRDQVNTIYRPSQHPYFVSASACALIAIIIVCVRQQDTQMHAREVKT